MGRKLSSLLTIHLLHQRHQTDKIKIVINYATQDPMTVHDLVKGVMKVYGSNGTLLKTSSSPTPFPVSASGKLQLTTTLVDNTIENITANIVFTNPIRTEIVSNQLPVKLDLFRGITSSSLDKNKTRQKWYNSQPRFHQAP